MQWRFWRRRDEAMPATDDPNWERALINKMAAEFLREQRRGQRWGLVFKFGILGYLLLLAGIVAFERVQGSLGVGEAHTAMVEIDGVIASGADASADRIVGALRKAFEADKSKAVLLRINSPGGSPVQSGYVFDEIKRLREKHPDKKVYVAAADICASGAYYIAAAADAIYVDKATLIGSIGVRIDSFGLQQAMEDLGVQRRLLTAGEYKGILDPFSPLGDFERAFVQQLLDELHGQFIAAVKQGRGDRLTDDPQLFTGLFWTGEQSVALGLSDGLGSPGYVAREVIGVEKIVKYTEKRDLVERFAERLGSAMGDALIRLAGSAAAPTLR